MSENNEQSGKKRSNRDRVASSSEEQSGSGRRQATPRRANPPATKRLGDFDGEKGEAEVVGTASWEEVYKACLVHSPRQWLRVIVSLSLIAACVFFFGVGLEFLSAGAQVMDTCVVAEFFKATSYPIVDVMVGVLATVLFQSFFTTSTLVVHMVGAEVIGVRRAIYIIMGCNIGSTVTNTIVSLGHFSRHDHLEVAFSGAVIHDIFNILAVSVLLPLEVATGFLYHLSEALIRGAAVGERAPWEGPSKKAIDTFASKVLLTNVDMMEDVATGGSCKAFYPLNCTDAEDPSYDSCPYFGLIACDEESGDCPVFFDPESNLAQDAGSGLVVLVMGILVIFISMGCATALLTKLWSDVPVRVIHKATDVNGYVLIAIGGGLTILLQSSSIVTSILTPLVGIGALPLERMYPLTIGANLGTTVTSVFLALAEDSNESLQVSLAHLMLNVCGMMVWYPIPAVRQVPIFLARRLAKFAGVWKIFPLLYILVVFLLFPVTVLGVESVTRPDSEDGDTSTVAIAVTVWSVGTVAIFVRWCVKGGYQQAYFALSKRRQNYLTTWSLTTRMDKAKKQIRHHQRYAGLPVRAETDDDLNDPRARIFEARAIQEIIDAAISTLARDMAFVETACSLLAYHTGMPADCQIDDDFPEEDEGDAETGAASSKTHSDEHSNSKHSSSDRRMNSRMRQALAAEKEPTLPKINFGLFVRQLPLSFSIVCVFGIPAWVWVIARLYSDDIKACVGAASVLTFLLGVLIACCAKWWWTPKDRLSIVEYWHNHYTRDDSLNRLPKDMPNAKSDLRELLRHYKLEFPEEEFFESEHTASGIQSNTDTPETAGR